VAGHAARTILAKYIITMTKGGEHAISCRTQAKRMTQPDDKSALEKMAQAWEKIAALRQQDLQGNKINARSLCKLVQVVRWYNFSTA
jgi:hypothetical protein